jgi:hypothetical protein
VSWHLVVHYLDVFRHDNAFAWNWATWIGNVTAGLIIASFLSLLYPPIREAVKTYIEGHVAGIHAKLDFHHEEMLRQAERHHAAQLKLARENHNAHMVALAKRQQPSVKKTPVKKVGLSDDKKGTNG